MLYHFDWRLQYIQLSLFTALNNGFVSATISFARTFLFQSIMVVFLPLVLGIDGIWLAIGVAELLALSVTALFFIKKKRGINMLSIFL